MKRVSEENLKELNRAWMMYAFDVWGSDAFSNIEKMRVIERSFKYEALWVNIKRLFKGLTWKKFHIVKDWDYSDFYEAN